MCDPMSMIGLIGSVAGALISYQQQETVMNDQQAANDAWVAYQRQAQEKALAVENQQREQADAARQQALTQVNAPAQKQQQATEQQRLTAFLTPAQLQQQQQDQQNNPTGTAPGRTQQLAGDALLSGQQNLDPTVQASMAAQLNSAAQDARNRIAALATIQSYGPSQFGLNQTVNQAYLTSGNAIGLAGDIRQGNLAALNVAKNVQPEQFAATPSPWPGIASALGGIAGKGIGMSGIFS